MHQEQITADAVLADGSTAARFARTAGALADFGRHHPTGAIGGIFLIIIMTMVLLANIISPFRYDRTVARQLLPPMSEATLDDGTLWIGTDELGAALAHGNRGRRPANATPSALASEAVRLARSRYAGVNHTHLSELLREREGIDIGRDTLRKILANAGVSSPRRRRPPKHRVRRQRMPREGMLIQVDGSYHRWLGEDGPQFTLLLAVDDATGVVADALFCELENTHSYFSLLDGLIRRCGIPIALYADRHAVFKYTPPSEAAAAPTQFSRAMDELGIQLIFARSSQGAGLDWH